MQKAEHLPNDLDDLPKEISKHSVEGAAWFILVFQSKMLKERKNLRGKLL